MLKQKIILSLEQALAMPYATQRFAQLGWRVIRIETPKEENENAGDPNRYIGADLGYHDLHSYYIAPNIGKEAITLNLKKREAQELLKKIIKELKVDVFMCNTLPKRYKQLGIDYESLKQANPDIIWCGISAMGPEYPNHAGYDPALQAQMGFTFLTGEPDGKPVPCGIPIIDLKAGDEAFSQVLLALLGERKKEIHISMAQCAASWLITALPQLNFVQSDNELFTRSGNEHRSFIPCNAYPTKDGFVYLAIGNDLQWEKFTSYNEFKNLSSKKRKTNVGRMKDKETIYKEIGEHTKRYTTNEFVSLCLSMNLSVAPVNSIKQVAELDFVKKCTIKTLLPNGNTAYICPPSSNTEFLEKNNFNLNCAPRLGENSKHILKECGIDENDFYKLTTERII
jgi:crotonobetainyl-CoA:carnitine CoA-transferase CaiB-like acyl-CoA transferase